MSLSTNTTFLDTHGNTPLHHAVRAGNLTEIQDLLQKGADINEKDNYGRTPLLLAVSKDLNKEIRALIE